MFSVLQRFRNQFQYFFNDYELNIYAEDQFVRGILSSLDCKIYEHGDTILEIGKDVEFLFFIQKEMVLVKDSNCYYGLVTLDEGSFFGDY